MPPIGTQKIDPDGIAAVTAWIASLPPLPPPTDGGPADGGPTDGGADGAD
jgi:hypothetical protein